MKNKYFGSEFYSSTLNTILLFVLIVLMVIALRFMYKNQETYIPVSKDKVVTVDNTMSPIENKTQILGNKDDLIAFSVASNTKVHGILSYRGVVKGGYFFEGNILINILDSKMNVLKKSNAVAKSDWMTAEPVNFEGNIDFTGLKKGNAYIEIQNDDPSGGEGGLAKKIQIPIIIE